MAVQEGGRAAEWVRLCSRQVMLPPEDLGVPDHYWILGIQVLPLTGPSFRKGSREEFSDLPKPQQSGKGKLAEVDFKYLR